MDEGHGVDHFEGARLRRTSSSVHVRAKWDRPEAFGNAMSREKACCVTA